MERRRKWIIGGIVLVLLLAGLFSIGYLGVFASDPYTVTEGTHFDATPGPEVILGENLETNNDHFFTEENTVDIGPATFSSDGSTEVEASGWGDEWTDLSQLDIDGAKLNVSVQNKQEVELEGGAETFEYRDMDVDDGTDDFRYSGGATVVTIHDLPEDTVIVADDTTSGELLDWAETTSNGELTLSLPDGEHDVGLRSASQPEIADGTAYPTAGQSGPQEDFGVEIDHDDISHTNVEVEFYHDGEYIGSDELSESGEASVNAEVDTSAGANNWHVVATDDFGNEVTSEFEYTMPDSLYIYDETDPDQLLDSVEVTLEFYFDNGESEVYERSSTDGEIDMTGLPADRPFVVVGEADGYHPRRIYLESLAESEDIFLLPEEEEFVDMTFELEDFSGDYPDADTVLVIERSLNGEWETVEGDYFGATGEFTAQLSYNTRHRLTLINTETGDEREMGTINPTASALQTVQVTGTETILIEDAGPRISISPLVRSFPAIETASPGIEVREGEGGVDSWSVRATFENESVATTLYQESFDDPDSVSPVFDLRDREDGTVTIEVEVTTEEGETMTQTAVFDIREHFEHEYSIFETLERGEGLLPEGSGDGATTFIAVISTVLISGSVAAMYTVSTETIGTIALISMSAWAMIGWLSFSVLFACAITAIAMWMIRRGI